jgi:hypothetical protein
VNQNHKRCGWRCRSRGSLARWRFDHEVRGAVRALGGREC